MIQSEKPLLKTRILSLIVGLIAVGAGGYLITRVLNNDYDNVLRVDGGSTFVVEIADESNEQYQGLSGRGSLNAYQGMLFVYDQPGKYSFVMRDMNFPLDFIWIDEEKNIIQITENVSPDTYPDQAFTSELPSQYIFEVNAGTATRENFEIGDKIEFNAD